MSAEREVLEVDALIVGAGPAGLATAYHLKRLLDPHGDGTPSVVVLEKGKEVGSHTLSGAVLDPRSIHELMPDWRERGAPVESAVVRDEVHFLTRNRGLRFPILPPPLRNHGNHIISLGRFVRWLAGCVEEAGVDVLTGFAGSELLIEDGRVVGVRTGDKGVDRRGQPKSNFEAGVDLRAKVTVLAEGVRGSLTEQAIEAFSLANGRNPQVYSVGVKEVWQTRRQENLRGRVMHTMGYPLSGGEFGGGFVYGLAEDRLSVGLVVGLDYRNPHLDPYERFQEYKKHPSIRGLLAGGSMVGYGAKAIPEGGYWARPHCAFDGGLIVGDAAGFLNSMRLKGIHLALKSGMLAAETLAEALVEEDTSSSSLGRFEDRVKGSWIEDELWSVRNFHQGFQEGFWRGVLHAGLQMVTGGRGLWRRYSNLAGHRHMHKMRDSFGDPTPSTPRLDFDGGLTFDKLSALHRSGTAHEEDQPVHLIVNPSDICYPRCTEEYGNPCRFFCPAAVYEMEPVRDGGLRLNISASNCVHCKTCDIMDPYQAIDWIPPEGGGGPGYEAM